MNTDEKYRAIRNRLRSVIPETTDVDADELARLLVELTTPGVELGAPAKTRGEVVAQETIQVSADPRRELRSFLYWGKPGEDIEIADIGPGDMALSLVKALRVRLAALIDAERADATKTQFAGTIEEFRKRGWIAAVDDVLGSSRQ